MVRSFNASLFVIALGISTQQVWWKRGMNRKQCRCVRENGAVILRSFQSTFVY